jgi:hypothetical protein
VAQQYMDESFVLEEVQSRVPNKNKHSAVAFTAKTRALLRPILMKLPAKKTQRRVTQDKKRPGAFTYQLHHELYLQLLTNCCHQPPKNWSQNNRLILPPLHSLKKNGYQRSNHLRRDRNRRHDFRSHIAALYVSMSMWRPIRNLARRFEGWTDYCCVSQLQPDDSSHL